MTDDLIKRLREPHRQTDPYDARRMDEAADALEAKDKRIAELEAESTAQCARRIEQCHRAERAEVRIAELEANRDGWKARAHRAEREREDVRFRAEKAEADLAAARAVLERIAVEPPSHNAASSLDRLMWAKEALPITAARGEQRSPEKSCETCYWDGVRETCIGLCDEDFTGWRCVPSNWQPKSDVCPTCGGSGEVEAGQAAGFGMTECWNCEGTGKKEAK